MPDRFRLWDNGGKTMDRYTILDVQPEDGVRYGISFSDAPYHPQGVGMSFELDRGAWAANVRDRFRSMGKRLKTVAGLPLGARRLVCDDFLPSQGANKTQLERLGCIMFGTRKVL